MSDDYCQPHCRPLYFWLFYLWVPLIIGLNRWPLPQLLSRFGNSQFRALPLEKKRKVQTKLTYLFQFTIAFVLLTILYTPNWKSMVGYFEPMGVWEICGMVSVPIFLSGYINDLFWNFGQLLSDDPSGLIHHCVSIVFGTIAFNNSFPFFVPRCSAVFVEYFQCLAAVTNVASIYYYCGANKTVKLWLYRMNIAYYLIQTLVFPSYVGSIIWRFRSDSVATIVTTAVIQIGWIPAQLWSVYSYHRIIVKKILAPQQQPTPATKEDPLPLLVVSGSPSVISEVELSQLS